MLLHAGIARRPLAAMRASAFERGQDRPPLRKARLGIHLEHAHRCVGTSHGTGLPDRLAQPGRACSGGVVQQCTLVTRERPETFDREPECLRRPRRGELVDGGLFF